MLTDVLCRELNGLGVAMEDPLIANFCTRVKINGYADALQLDTS
jgi:hypothetical protein